MFLGRVGIGVKLLGVLVHGRQALADRALGHAVGLHDGVDLGGMVLDDVHAGLVDLVRRHVGGGPLHQRVAVILLALGQLPHAGVMRGLLLQLLHQRDLAIQRGIDAVLHHLRGRGAPVAGDVLFPGAAHHRFRHRAGFGRGRTQLGQGRHQLGQREVGRDHAQAGIMALHVQFLVHGMREGAQPRDIGVGVVFRLDGVLGVQEGRRVDGIAGQLAEDIGLPRAGRAVIEVAVGVFTRRKVEHHHVKVGLVLAEEGIAVECLQPLELAGVHGLLLGDAGQRGVVDQPLFAGALGGIQAQRGGQGGGEVQRLLHEVIEQRVQRGTATSRESGRRGTDGKGGGAGFQRGTAGKHENPFGIRGRGAIPAPLSCNTR